MGEGEVESPALLAHQNPHHPGGGERAPPGGPGDGVEVGETANPPESERARRTTPARGHPTRAARSPLTEPDLGKRSPDDAEDPGDQTPIFPGGPNHLHGKSPGKAVQNTKVKGPPPNQAHPGWPSYPQHLR